MKYYEFAAAPNPRRVRIFAAEKGIALPTTQVNLREGEQLSPAYRAINPQCVVPFLQLDDGTGIGEVVAICRYLEEIHPLPPLLGTDPTSKALVAMWEHRAECEGLVAVRDILRNSSQAFRGRALAGPVDLEQLPALVERGRICVKAFFAELDGRLADNAYLAGRDFTMADITALVTVDFAGWVKMPIPDELVHLRRWHQTVSSRPSAKA
jgi:glutathione S-transferase